MSSYTGQNARENGFSTNVSTSTILTSDNEELKSKPRGGETEAQAVIRSRMNPALACRLEQIAINILGAEGGRPYIDRRLAKFPGETDIQWNGGSDDQSNWIQGRREQSHVVPYLGRITNKINQSVFGPGIKREGGDPDVMADITRNGVSVNEFMVSVSSLITSAGWCWIGIDAPKVEGELTRDVADANKIRPYWVLYNATEVIDWHFGAQGELAWVLVEGVRWEDSNPTQERKRVHARWLWTAQDVTEYTFKPCAFGDTQWTREIVSQDIIPHSFGVVPFMPAGRITESPITFDSLEGINKTIMDLNSASRQNFFEGVYPQLVLPASMLQHYIDKESGVINGSKLAIAIGQHDPIFANKDDAEAKYITANGQDLATVRAEATDLRVELFMTAGLAMQQESRAAQSGDAKAWDHLEIEQGFKERAALLQEIEEKAIALTKRIDSSFKEWSVAYPTQFDIRNFEAEIRALVMAGQVQMPAEVEKLVISKLVGALDQVGVKLTDEEREAARAAIEAYERQSFEPVIDIGDVA